VEESGVTRVEFPILKPVAGGSKSVPWAWIEQYRSVAMRNHYQTLERLAERGGLSPGEIWLLIAGVRPSRMPRDVSAVRFQNVIDRTIERWRQDASSGEQGGDDGQHERANS
jgi:hypothetical protein